MPEAEKILLTIFNLKKKTVTSHFPLSMLFDNRPPPSSLNPAGSIQDAVREACRRKRAREAQQTALWEANDDFKETIRSKLDGRWDEPQFTNFSRCGLDEMILTCRDCGEVKKLPYRCNIKWCPRCAWRIAEKRKNIIKLFASRIQQPKHLVLTQKNFEILTNRKIKKMVACLSKMRKRKCMKNVRGGWISIEITNENQGWHLHSHWLVDADWLPMADVSVNWGKLVNQEFAICKIKDVRDRDYLREICKYVVEGSELAKW